MDLETVITGGALIIAAASFVFSAWFSERSATAAEESAAAGARSAKAAEEAAVAGARSAEAAERSVKIAEAARYREDMPAFTLRPIAPANGAFAVEITMVSGPSAIKVEAAQYSGFAFGPTNEHGASEGRVFLGVGPSHRPVELIRNDSFWLYMDVIDGAVRAKEVKVYLLCEEIEERRDEETVDPGRRWWVREDTCWPL